MFKFLFQTLAFLFLLFLGGKLWVWFCEHTRPNIHLPIEKYEQILKELKFNELHFNENKINMEDELNIFVEQLQSEKAL